MQKIYLILLAIINIFLLVIYKEKKLYINNYYNFIRIFYQFCVNKIGIKCYRALQNYIYKVHQNYQKNNKYNQLIFSMIEFSVTFTKFQSFKK